MERRSRSKTRGPVPENRPLPHLRLRPIHASPRRDLVAEAVMASPARSGGDAHGGLAPAKGRAIDPRGRALAALAGAIARTTKTTQLAGLTAERSPEPIHDQKRWAAWPRHEPQRSETVLREGARADPPAVGALPRRVLGRNREKAPTLAPNDRALVERANDLRCLRVDEARCVQ